MDNIPVIIWLVSWAWFFMQLRRAGFGRVRSVAVGGAVAAVAFVLSVAAYVSVFRVNQPGGAALLAAVVFLIPVVAVAIHLRGGCRHRLSEMDAGRPAYGLWHHVRAAAAQARDRRLAAIAAATRPARTQPPATKVADVPQAAAPARAAASKPSVPTPGGSTFRFLYRKPDGAEQTRTVHVQRHGSESGHRFVEGVCADAGAMRSFRLDRIRGKVTDMETGELLSPSQMFRGLGASAGPLEVSSYVTAKRASGTARRPGWQTAVYFAGFGANQYGELSSLAERAGMDVRTTISRSVDVVVAGNLAGHQQRAQAETQGIPVIDEDAFRAMV